MKQKSKTNYPSLEQVEDYLLYYFKQVAEIAFGRAAHISINVDNFAYNREPRVRCHSYIEGLVGGTTNYPTVEHAVIGLIERDAEDSVSKQVRALRAQADDLERGVRK